MANRWEQVYKYDKKTKSWVVDEKKTQEAVKRNNDYRKSSSASRYGSQKSSTDAVDPISTAEASSYTPTKKSEKPAKTYDLNTNVGLDDADKANDALNAQAAGKGMINTINSVPVWTEWQNSVLYKPGSSYTIKNSPMYSDIGYAKSEQDINRQWMMDGHEYLNLSDEGFKTLMSKYDEAMGYTDSTWRLLNARVGNEHVIDQATNWKEKQKLQGAYNLSGYDQVPRQLATNVPEDFKRDGITTYRDLYNKQVAYSRDQMEKDLKTIDSFYNARYAMPGMRFDAEAEQEFADAVSRYEEYSGVDLTNMPADYDGKWIKRMMSSYDADTDMLRGVVEGSEGNWDFDDVYNRDKALLDEQRQKEQADAKGKKFEAEAGEMEAAVQNTEGYADKSQYIPGTQYWMPGSDDYNILAGGSMPSPEDTTSWEERNNRVRYSFINDFLAAVEAKDDATISDMREIAGNLGALDGYDLDAMTNMDEDQIKTAFAYINGNNYQGFEDYMRKINYDLSRKSYEKWEEAEQLKAQGRNFWEHMGASITTWPQNVLASASGLTNDISAWLEKFGIDIRDPYLEHEFSNYNRWGADVDIIRGGADQYIRDNTWSLPENIPVVGGFNPLGTLYQGAMSLGDVGLARLAGDWLGGSLGLAGKAAKKFSQFVSGLHMFGIEVGRSLQEAMATGQDNAALKATGDATLSAIFENIGLDKVLSGNLLKAAIGEGSEEFFTGATQMVWDALLNREDSKPAKLLDKYRIMGYASKAEFAAALDTAADLFEQFMSGFSAGGVGGVTPAVTNQVQNVKAGRTIQQFDTAQPILDLAATLDLEPSVLQLVQEQQAALDAMKASQQESEAQSEEDQDNLDDEAAIESEEEDQEAEVLPERGEYEFDGNESTLTPVGNEQEAEKLPNREEAMPDGRESTLTPAEEQQQEAEKLPNREESQPDGRESTLTPANEQRQEAEKLSERETTMPDGESTLTPASEENAPAAEEAGDVSEAAEDMAEAAEDAAESPAPKKGKKVKVPKVSNAKLGRIYREALAKLDERAQDVLRKSFETEISQQLQERGFKGDPRTTAEAISKMVSGDASMITPEVVLAVSSDRMVLEIVNDFTAPIREFQRMAALGAGGIPAIAAKNAKGKYSTANGQRFVPERIVSISDDGKVRVTGKTVHGEVMTVDADSIDFGINDGGIEIVADVAGILGRNADALLNNMQGSQDPVKYALAFKAAMEYGQNGRSLSSAKSDTSLSTLTESQIEIAHSLGKDILEKGGRKPKKNISGISVGNVDTSAISGVKLSKQQKASINAMTRLAKVVGFNVKFVKSKADADGKYKTENGSWESSTMTLTLDIHAGSNKTTDLNYAMMHTAGHELTHFIKDFADAGLWNDYQEFVMDHLYEKMSDAEIEKRIKDHIKRAEKRGETMTRDGALEEVIADASGEALMNITEADLRQIAQSNPTLFGRIKQFFKKWLSDLKTNIDIAYSGNQNKTAETKAMHDVVDQLSEKWNKLFVNAVQNKAVASEATNTAVQDEASTGKATVSMRDSAAEAKPHTVSKQNETTAGAKVQPLTYNHIDTRTDESVRSVDVDLFCNEVEEAQVGFAAAAKMLLADANNSISGQKFFTGDGEVTGQKRQTSDLLARMKDETNWTWDHIRKSLQQFADMDNAEKGYPVPKNTLTNRRMELYLDEVLTEGYKTLDGMNITQWGEYVEAKAGYKGSKKAGMNYRSPANAIAFEDYAFADAGDMKYSDRPGKGDWYDYSASFAQQVQDWLDNKIPQRDTLVVGRMPEVLRKIGFSDLPLVYDQKHMRNVLGKPKNPDHDLGVDFMKHLPEYVSNPIAIFENAEHPEAGVVMMVAGQNDNADGRRIVGYINVNEGGQINGISIDAVRLKTVHSESIAVDKLEAAIENELSGNVGLYYWNKKEALTYIRPGQAQRLGRSLKDGFNHSITEEASPVKAKSLKQTDSSQFRHWFKGSKIVNEDGSPKVMYHGTPYGGFTVFKDWQYFTDNQAYADVYHEPSASSIRGRYNPATNPQTYAVYLSVKKPFDTRDPKIRKIWQEEFYNQYSRTPLSDKGLPDWTDGIDLVEFIEDNDYDFDAIILDEGATGGYGDEVRSRGVSVVVRSSNQIKSATDNIGTFDPANPDIRYQERDLSQLSDRELLANAVESVAQNDTERDYIKRYKKHIAELNEKQLAMQEAEEQIRELKAEDAKGNRDEIIKLQNKVDIYAKQISRADAKLLDYEATKPIKDMLTREKAEYKRKRDAKAKEQMARYRENQHQRTLDRIREVREAEANKRKAMRERADERQRKAVEHAREVGQRKVDRMKESQGKEKYRAQILQDAKKLYGWVVSPTNKGHVPAFLREPLAGFIESIDFTSARQLKGGDPTKNDAKFEKALDKLRDAIGDINKQQSDIDGGAATFAGYIDLPSDYMDEFNTLVRNIKTTLEISEGAVDTPFNRMTADQLHEMSKMFRILNSSISKMNQLVANGRYESAKTASNDTIADMNAMNAKVKTNKVLSTLNTMFNWKNTTPYYAFQRLGRGGKAIFEGLQDGWDKMAQNSKKLIEYAEDAFTSQQAKAWSKDIKTIELDSGEKFQMTASQAMSLYCLSKRQQAIGHLKGGGIRVSDIDAGKGNTISQVDNYILSEADISRIIGTLTAEQKGVADKLQRFMNTVCTEWGNEISMKRFGYEMFTEDNYFPIETDANNRSRIDDKQDGNNSMFRLLNMSAMKQLTPNANNAIIIRDIFDVFSNHASDIGKYNALALPILDFIKWYNFVEKSEVLDANGKPTGQIITRSTQKALERAFGQDAKTYLMSFIKDLNAEHDGGRNDTVLSKLMGHAKAGSVSANMRVAFLQITSLPRAAYAIDPKYLLKGMAKVKSLNPATAIKGSEAQENIGILKWKNLGFYSTDVSRSTRSMVRRDEGVITKIRDLVMKPAEWGDNWTSNIIYEAAKAEMADKHPNVKPGTKAYDAMLNKRVREIVYKTQVVDSTMTRSDFMRSKGLMTAFTAFMSEPTLTVNMLNESIQEAVANARTGMSARENLRSVGGKAVRAATVMAFTATAAALVESLFDALRDDDDYEEFQEKFADAFGGNIVDNVNVFAMLPILKDAISVMQGYENSSMVTQVVSQYKDVQEAITAWQEGKRPIYSVIYNMLKVAASATGVGVQSATRDAVGLYNTFLADAFDTPKIQTYSDSKSKAAEEFYEALQAGDEEKVEWIMQRAEINGIALPDISDKIATLVKNEFVAGDITEEEATRRLVEYGGKDENEAYWKIQEWGYSGEGNFSKYTGLKDALKSGDRAAANAARDELVEHGASEQAISGQLSEIYNNGEATSILNLQMRSDSLYTSSLKLKADGEAHPDDFDAFITAIVNGGNISGEIDALMDKGYTVKQCMSAINGAFGKSKDTYRIMETNNSSDAGILLDRILDAYEYLGLDRAEEIAWIDANWIM